ncbi:MAG: hypothetical protein HN976_15540 [Lentisphaerae bacterium]|nr:hypothetical protein [Lentisphaerota bacterium]
MNNALTFPKLSRFDRVQEPCNVAVPFAAGVLPTAADFVILDDGQPIPTQPLATASWPDGSVKWVHADFLANLPGNQSKTFNWSTNSPAGPTPASPATAEREADTCLLKTGAVTIRLGAPGTTQAIAGIAIQGFELSSDERPPPLLSLLSEQRDFGAHCSAIGEVTDDVLGPVLVDESGTEWTAVLDDEWNILREGPIHVIVEASGKHRNAAGDSLLDFAIRCHVFAGKPWFQVDYRLINREETAHVMLHSLGLKIRPSAPTGDAHTAVATSNYRTRIKQGENGKQVSHCIDAEQLVYEANEQVPETNYGTFWADWTEPNRGGLCVTVHQAHQNFPKALSADGNGIDIWLYPDQSPPLCVRQGVARTQRLLFHPHGANVEAAIDDVKIRSLQFQMPDRPILSAETYRDAGVFEPVWIGESVQRIEAFLFDSADNRARGYGILNWGDGPDSGYTNQGRGHGKPVWTNNEYDLPHAAMLMFARTGERRMLDYLLVAAEHQMDVDVCHFSADPLRHEGQLVHTAHHVTGGVTPSHEWVEGLLDLYHMTADPTALETAIGIGQNLRRHLERPQFRQAAASSARETGWALRALTALYRETGDAEWMEPAAFIVEQFQTWQEEYGAWLAPYTDHTLVRVPFMISVAASSLMRHYWVTGAPQVGEMIVAAMRDLITHSLRSDGRFYYKELPSLERRGAGFYVLEALAYAYDISGDDAFIRAGLPTFEELLGSRASGTRGKYAIDDAVIWEAGPSPKAFASTFPPVVMFARAAVDAGLLQ